MFCINSPLLTVEGVKVSAESWFQAHRRSVAALLTQEQDIERLSKQSPTNPPGATSVTTRMISWWWTGTPLLIDEHATSADALHLGTANLQLAELEACDRCDNALDRSCAIGGQVRSAATSCANCAKSASTWRASMTSCRTSQVFR